MKRNTNQRAAIKKVFQKIDRPLSIEEILEAGREAVESLNQATVYRNLKILVQEGWLTRISTPDMGALYEIAGKAHHHHFQCRACDRMFEVDGCAFNETSSTPPGFVTESHEVFLFGLCAACRQ
jgi:Fur family transcriptional regulator, ferric uptake regulator